MEIPFATSNIKKVIEGNNVGRLYGINFKRIKVNYPEIRDSDVGRVAIEGAKYVFKRIGRNVIVEDTGLFIDALNGFPGSYSAFVFNKIGNRGILKLMKGIRNRNAEFISAIGYCDKDCVRVFKGRIKGTITYKERGDYGFGYDPIFKPVGSELTFAEDPEMKNRVSHRRNAFENFCRWIVKL
ncbi:MAG: non-canonical purine NTP pyrophosphatase, RdgB/HAM1 family [Candidatus Altiarchaeales archaeon]|nr:MAG: non-canonical purine NTP pyrophosphatase, RdgB/HAM1 family [Candidatus Altiarchaeales archaeon]